MSSNGEKKKYWMFASIAGLSITLASAVRLHWPGMGDNLLAEAIGIAFTIVIIDRVISWESEARLRPARLAAFRDAMEISHSARSFVLALSNSSIPHEELERVKACAGAAPEKWLCNHIANLGPNSIAPFSSGIGSAPITWGVMLPTEVSKLEKLIDRYLVRHAALGDPEVTEAVHDFEENGLFRSLSYGTDLFWLNSNVRRLMFEHFVEKLAKLIEVTAHHAPIYAGNSERLANTGFNWKSLVIEVEANPVANGRVRYRPTG